MNYLRYELDAGPNNIIQVNLDKRAYVRLMDYSNFQNYHNGRQYKYYGGLANVSPAKIRPPYQGHWYLVIDLDGHAGTVRSSVNIL